MRYLRNIIINCAVVSTLAASTFPAPAGTGEGLVHGIAVVNTAVVITVDTHVDKPVCDKYTNQFEFDVGTDSGKAYLATVLVAANAKIRIRVIGAGTCAAPAGRRENVGYIETYY